MVLLNAYNCELFEASNTKFLYSRRSVMVWSFKLPKLWNRFMLLFFSKTLQELVHCSVFEPSIMCYIRVPVFFFIWCKGDWKQLISWAKMTVNYFFMLVPVLYQCPKRIRQGFDILLYEIMFAQVHYNLWSRKKVTRNASPLFRRLSL